MGGLAGRIALATAARLLFNTARRFPYPFAPALSRGMGVPLTAVTALIGVNQITGLFGLLFGPMADRLGYRRMMGAGTACLAVGMLAAAFFPCYPVVMAGLFLAGLGKIIYDPALQGFIGRFVPFSRRGLVFGGVETSWAGATLVGVPVIGLLMEHFGWRAPFFLVGGLAVVFGGMLVAALPSARPEPLDSGKRQRLSAAWGEVLESRAARGALWFSFLVSVANDNLFVAYGAWLETEYGLSLVALGLATITVGVAELAGEGMVALFGDRSGLYRSVLGSTVLAGLAYAALPLYGQSLAAALTGLFVVFLVFEYSVVCSISLFTELRPKARATMMAGFFAAACVGRVTGALLGGPAWMYGGIEAVGAISGGISLVAALVLWRGLRGWRP
ncbi:MAG: MFS transporter [Desulfatibacillaceae bacterium]